ncbi:MAG: hypothetical protein JWO31_2069 [Phycisphaerales bacterium]|nr:hypothetical protein [Phycisphaerales bacterium]
MTPGLLLALLFGATLAAVVIDAGRRTRRHHAARRLAADWRMNFGRTDSLGLTARIAPLLPAPGAAAVRVSDVVYGTRGNESRYVFTAEYTVGVTGSKQRHVRAAAFTEPRDRRRGGQATLVMGDPDLPLDEQYASLAPADVEPGDVGVAGVAAGESQTAVEGPGEREPELG